MRILFIGGTGILSRACTELALARGHDVYVLNRGQRSEVPEGARALVADVHEDAAVRSALGARTWDAVVDFIAFTPEDIERDLSLFRGSTAAYVFISSASAYQRPCSHYLVTESTPLANPFWSYSRDKIACEERLTRALRDERFPAVIVRPSLTFGDTQITLAINSWQKSYTVVDRMRRGLAVIVPGDGTSLWTITHNTDFAKGLVGLLGCSQAIGHAFHITSDEVQTWDQYYRAVAAAAGVSDPKLVHIATDFIADCLPDMAAGLLGDKATSVVMDNTKIKRFVPDFAATMRFRDGMERTLRWFDGDASRRVVDDEANRRYDRLLSAYARGLDLAKREFALSG
ncbi:MAG: SDR family oxidoreductase [Polyangiaceae bacterium]|jgi:nucleoside-diphosphate-sugar epimerase